MESNIKGLVSAGHEMASELKEECGAVDMRSVAKLISDLATQLEVQLVRANALAAENAGLKSVIEYCINPDNQPEYHDQGMGCGVEDHGYQRDGYSACYYGWESAMERVYSEVIPDAIPETPATDAFLAEIRAEARNEGINYTASRLAAAFNHGFINKSLREVFDVTRMILSAKEELANEPHPIDGLSGEYAEKSLEEWAEQIRKGGNQ